MPYADAVISESMRLHLPAAILGFEACKDVVVGGVTVPNGTRVMISQSKTAVSDDHFTNAKQFWPEVATGKQPAPLHTVSDDANKPFVHDGKSLYPFGTGPRVCPGQQLALTNIKLHFEGNVSAASVLLINIRLGKGAGIMARVLLRKVLSAAWCLAQRLSAITTSAVHVALATLLSSYNVSLKPDHPVPRGINDLGYTPDAVHIILNKLRRSSQFTLAEGTTGVCDACTKPQQQQLRAHHLAFLLHASCLCVYRYTTCRSTTATAIQNS
eukprot:1765-Heterococcus_DN1.PRE.2